MEPRCTRGTAEQGQTRRATSPSQSITAAQLSGTALAISIVDCLANMIEWRHRCIAVSISSIEVVEARSGADDLQGWRTFAWTEK